MDRLYTFLIHIALPFVLARLLWRSRRAPEYRRRWGERFGRFPGTPLKRSLWIHSVSVGETQAAEPLIRQLLDRHPELPLVITTTTLTGSKRVQELFGDQVRHGYFPYDLPFALERFLDHTNPAMLVLMETEIWPNLLRICQERGVFTLLANARLSQRSARGYRRIAPYTRRVFARIGLIAAQHGNDAERFVGLGVEPRRVVVTGSIKFDTRLPASLHEQAAVLRRDWIDRPVWIAASTHEGEEELLLKVHRRVMEIHPAALLILVPRHPERFDRVAALIEREGFPLTRRSSGQPCPNTTAVFLGDSMGELTLLMAAADVAFVGGSLIRHGGHNLLEPASLGLPIVFGPHTFNFAAIGDLLLTADAAVRIGKTGELTEVITRWLGDASERSRIGENGRRAVEENRGALKRLYRLIDERLGEAG